MGSASSRSEPLDERMESAHSACSHEGAPDRGVGSASETDQLTPMAAYAPSESPTAHALAAPGAPDASSASLCFEVESSWVTTPTTVASAVVVLALKALVAAVLGLMAR